MGLSRPVLFGHNVQKRPSGGGECGTVKAAQSMLLIGQSAHSLVGPPRFAGLRLVNDVAPSLS